MAIHERIMYSCVCDACGDLWRDDHSGYIAFDDISSLKDYIETDDWREHNNKWYCPDCYNIDDDDIFTVDLYKARMSKIMKLKNDNTKNKKKKR